MRFVRTTEQSAVAAALRDLLESVDSEGIARRWNADGGSWRSVWGKLADMGVTGVLVPEESGGLGLGPVELVACLEEIGYAGLPGPLVESAAVLPLLLRGTEWPGRIASGHVCTLAWDEQAPYALDADRADSVFTCRQGEVATAHATAQVESIDPTHRLFTVDDDETIGEAPGSAFEHGVLGCAAQQLGVGRRLLDLATEHVKQRRQFGRPIGEFQAVKHHLANVLLGLEFARPLLHGACLSTGTRHGPRDVSAAKVAVGDAAYRAARTALQVHGAIGYTTEHPLHLWLTKATALRNAWGTQAWHRRRVADALRTDSSIPVGTG